MRGYNETEHPPNVSDYTVSKLCRDVAELIPVLGHNRAILVAHDWGAGVAWSIAQRWPELVERLIVMNGPNARVMEKRMKRFSQLLKSWYVFFFQVPWFPEFLLSSSDYKFFDGLREGNIKDAFTAEDVEAYKYVFSQEGAFTGPVNYYRCVFRKKDEEHMQSRMIKIEVPTLLIWGDDDPYVENIADQHVDVVKDLTVRHVEKVGHWVQNESPETVNRHMREFLKKSSN